MHRPKSRCHAKRGSRRAVICRRKCLPHAEGSRTAPRRRPCRERCTAPPAGLTAAATATPVLPHTALTCTPWVRAAESRRLVPIALPINLVQRLSATLRAIVNHPCARAARFARPTPGLLNTDLGHRKPGGCPTIFCVLAPCPLGGFGTIHRHRDPPPLRTRTLGRPLTVPHITVTPRKGFRATHAVRASQGPSRHCAVTKGAPQPCLSKPPNLSILHFIPIILCIRPLRVVPVRLMTRRVCRPVLA